MSEDDDAFESAESESGCGSLSSTSEEAESVRMRVRRKILQRVQELHVASGDDSDAQLDAQIHSYSTTLHAAQQEQHERPAISSSDSLEADEQLDLEHLRADVISVAAQILERHLSHQSPQTNQSKRGYKHENGAVAAGASLELRLVHRMLAKESELLALQALRLQVRPSGAGAAASIHGRGGGRRMDAL